MQSRAPKYSTLANTIVYFKVPACKNRQTLMCFDITSHTTEGNRQQEYRQQYDSDR